MYCSDDNIYFLDLMVTDPNTELVEFQVFSHGFSFLVNLYTKPASRACVLKNHRLSRRASSRCQTSRQEDNPQRMEFGRDAATELTEKHTHVLCWRQIPHFSRPPILCPPICLPTLLIGFTLKLLLFLSSPTISSFHFLFLIAGQNYCQSLGSPLLCSSPLYPPHTHTLLAIYAGHKGQWPLSRLWLNCPLLALCNCVPVCLSARTHLLITPRLQSGLPCAVNLMIDPPGASGWMGTFEPVSVHICRDASKTADTDNRAAQFKEELMTEQCRRKVCITYPNMWAGLLNVD